MAALQSLKSLVDAAIFIAGPEFDNRDVPTEALVPIVFQEVARRYAADPKRRPLLLETFNLSFTSGVSTLPNEVLVDCLDSAVIAQSGQASRTKQWRYVSWLEFTRPLDSTLGYFAVRTGIVISTDVLMYVTIPGSAYDPTTGFTGTLSVTTPVVPRIPVGQNDTVKASQEMQQDITLGLARAIRGEWFTGEVS